MGATTINIRTDSEVKAQAQDVFAKLGMDLSTAINLFLRQVIYKQGVSFDISAVPFKKKAKLGGWEEKIKMSDDFNAPLDDFKEYMQ
jgi:DNA-damage-inducible protein J